MRPFDAHNWADVVLMVVVIALVGLALGAGWALVTN